MVLLIPFVWFSLPLVFYIEVTPANNTGPGEIINSGRGGATL